jgi:hypothetical protein
MTVDRDQRREMTRYCIAVYLFAALLLDAVYQLHLMIGGRQFTRVELLSTFVFFSVWLPFMPLVVRLAHAFVPVRGRRLRAFEVHFSAAVVLSFVTLTAHRMVFCGRQSYWHSVFAYKLDSWLMRWFAVDCFVYAGVVSAIWLALLAQRSRLREIEATAMERELASTELHLMSAQINPESLIEIFGAIAARVMTDRARAERMIARVADFLRLNLRAVGNGDLTVADDVELLRAWLAVERERTGVDAAVDLDIDRALLATPIVTPRLQALAARMPAGTRALTVRATRSPMGVELSVTPAGANA